VPETPDKDEKADKKPEAVLQVSSGRVTVTLVSLAALAIGGAAIANSLPATANFLPSFSLPNFSLPDFNRFTLPKLDRIALPNFSRAPAPKSDRVAAPIPPKPAPAPVLVPDPFVHAALIDIQQSQQQSAAVLATLTQDSANQQADLRRISRQLSTLAARVEALNGTMGPLTTSSIPNSNPRARIIRTARRAPPPALPASPSLPKPVGPVSVGGAPLAPTSAAGSGA
jgi:hypothetical protein